MYVSKHALDQFYAIQPLIKILNGDLYLVQRRHMSAYKPDKLGDHVCMSMESIEQICSMKLPLDETMNSDNSRQKDATK